MILTIHPRITIQRILNAVEDADYTGFCTSCGHEQGGCEPDMENGTCENCGTNAVYGAEELAIRIG